MRTGSAIAVAALLVSTVALPARTGTEEDLTRPPDTTEGRPPIVIGVSNVQSGPSRFLGEMLLRGSRTYFDRVNAAGGVNGRTITLVTADFDPSQPTAPQENAACNTFTQDNKVFAVLALRSDATEAYMTCL